MELPKEIQRARELGDLRENAEYQAAKERQTYVKARIGMLQKRVAEIALMNMDRIPHGKAGFGSTVTSSKRTAQKLVYQLVMPEDADAEKGLISTSSPIGRAILNKEEATRSRSTTPGGTREFEIVKLVTIHDEAPDERSAPTRRRLRPPNLFTGTPHRAGADRHRRRRRVPRRRAARAARSRRQDRHRRRPRHRRASARCSPRSTAAQRLWDDKGFWRAPARRPALSLALAAAAVIVRGAGAVAGDRRRAARGRWPPGSSCIRSIRCCGMVGARAARRLVERYLRLLAERRSRPTALPTWLPRLVLLVLCAAARSSLASAHGWRWRRRCAGAGGVLVDAARRAARCRAAPSSTAASVLWDLLRGAAQLKTPAPADLSRRYANCWPRTSASPVPRAAARRSRSRRAARPGVRPGARAVPARSVPAADRRRRRAPRRGVRSRRRRARSPGRCRWPRR